MWQWCWISCVNFEEDVCLVDGLFQLPVLTGVKCSAMRELSVTEDSQHNWISPGDTYGWVRSLSKEQESPYFPRTSGFEVPKSLSHEFGTAEYGMVIFNLIFSAVLFHCCD